MAAERVLMPPPSKPPQPPEAENWDDDFEFHSPADDHTKPREDDVPIGRSSFSSSASGAPHLVNRDTIVWDDDDDDNTHPLDDKLTGTRRAAQADSGDWGDSDDDRPNAGGLRGIGSGLGATTKPRAFPSPDPSPGKWTTDGEDSVGPSSPYDVDRTVTINNRTNFGAPPPPPPMMGGQEGTNGSGTRSAMSSSASLPQQHHHVHIPNPHDRYSPTPYSPTSPTLSSAFSMGASSTAHLRQTTSRHSSMIVTAPPPPPVVYQAPPRPRRRLRKKSRPPQTEVGDIFEMEEQYPYGPRGFQDELEDSMDSNHNHYYYSSSQQQSPKSTSLHLRRPGSSAGPSAHQIFSPPTTAAAMRSRSQSQSSQRPHHPAHALPPGALQSPPLPNSSTSEIMDVVEGATISPPSFVPSSPSAKTTALLSRIGSMKNWSSKRRARQSTQSVNSIPVADPETSSASESHWNEDDERERPLTTPEPVRERTASPSSWAFREASSPPPVEDTSAVLTRRGSKRSYTSATAKPALSKVLGLMSTAPPTATPPSSSQDRPLRRPMSMVGQAAPARPSSSSRPATYGRSTSNPFTQDYSSSSSSKSRPSLTNSASFFGLKGLAHIGNHRRNKSIGADSRATDESFGSVVVAGGAAALPPLPSTPKTPRPASPVVTKISDKPPVLPALPPIDIELSPPSPPRMFASASQPVHPRQFPGIGVVASASRSPGGTSSLGRANGMALLAGGVGVGGGAGSGGGGSMRRNSLGDLKIPARISRNQVALKSNLTMVREFAAIVEQLKDLQNNYSKTVVNIRQSLDTGDGPKGSVERLGNGHGVRPPGAGPPLLYDPSLRQATETLKRLDDEYALWWECAELLIELGGGAKDEKDQSPIEPEPIPESPVLASQSSIALAEPPQTFEVALRERERAITLGGTESSALAASAVAAAGGSKGSSSGRHGLSQRQLALLKEMLTTPDPSTLSFPMAGSLSADHANKPQSPLMFKDALGPPPAFQTRQHHHQPYRSNFPAASAVTLPESSSSSAPSRSQSRLPPVSFGGAKDPSAPLESKPRRGSRLNLTGIRDMLRSLKKATAAQQAAMTLQQSKANESQSSFDSRHGHGVPPPAPRQVSQTRKGEGSTEVKDVAAGEGDVSLDSIDSSMPEFPTRPYSSQANRKSPRRPSLASLFRIGNSSKSEKKKKQQQQQQHSSAAHDSTAGSAADTTTEDDSDWDRIDSASDLDFSVRCGETTTADMEQQDRSANQATVRGRRTLVKPKPESMPSSPPTAYPGMPSASQSSLSLRNSPQHRPTRLPASITEETPAYTPPPTQRSTSYTYQRPSSRSGRNRQVTSGSLPPIPFNSLMATLSSAEGHGHAKEDTITQATPTRPPPLQPAATPEVRLAMTPENIKPLLECSKEVSARLNDCLKELERLNLAVVSP